MLCLMYNPFLHEIIDQWNRKIESKKMEAFEILNSLKAYIVVDFHKLQSVWSFATRSFRYLFIFHKYKASNVLNRGLWIWDQWSLVILCTRNVEVNRLHRFGHWAQIGVDIPITPAKKWNLKWGKSGSKTHFWTFCRK